MTESDLSVGGWFAGMVLEVYLFGILTVQTAVYYRNYPKDKNSTKIIVGLLFLLQAFMIGCFGFSMYLALVTLFTAPPELIPDLHNHCPWQFITFQIVVFAASVIVQTFFVRRIYEMSNSLWLACFIEALVLVELAFGIVVAVEANKHLGFTVFAKRYERNVLIWIVMEAAVDAFVAASMVYLLNQRRTGFKTTDTLINSLVIYSVATGAITCLVACVLLITFTLYGFCFVVNLLSVPFGCIYSVTMLANLHSRMDLAEKGRLTGMRTDISIRTTRMFHGGLTQNKSRSGRPADASIVGLDGTERSLHPQTV